MDGPGEHYAGGNKPVGGRQIQCDLTHVESDEHTELISETDRLMDGEQMAAFRRRGG